RNARGARRGLPGSRTTPQAASGARDHGIDGRPGERRGIDPAGPGATGRGRGRSKGHFGARQRNARRPDCGFDHAERRMRRVLRVVVLTCVLAAAVLAQEHEGGGEENLTVWKWANFVVLA